MSEEDWTIPTNGETYLRHQQKSTNLADRRPVPRKAADLGLGPGMGASAVRIEDFSDLLATFNGYYAAAPGAAGAPNATDTFVGYVVSDSEFGGRQVFTSLESGVEFSRTFYRSSTDPESLGWTDWTGQRIPATATGYERVATWTQPGAVAVLRPPVLTTVGEPGLYETSAGGIRVRRQGIYTGHIQVGDYYGDAIGDIYPSIPNGSDLIMLGQLGRNLAPTATIPFTVVATNGDQGFSVNFVLASSFTSGREIWWRFSCTRVGDAI